MHSSGFVVLYEPLQRATGYTEPGVSMTIKLSRRTDINHAGVTLEAPAHRVGADRQDLRDLLDGKKLLFQRIGFHYEYLS